jgi:hypothetical protein
MIHATVSSIAGILAGGTKFSTSEMKEFVLFAWLRPCPFIDPEFLSVRFLIERHTNKKPTVR